MQTMFYPCLWCDGTAAEAAAFYCGIFPHAHILSDNGMVVKFSLNGSLMMALNGGPRYKPNQAVSLVIECDTQEEIDHYWNALTEGGHESRCGWLTDRYGLSWQVVPRQLGALLADPAKAQEVTDALLKMNKLDLQLLRQAAGQS